MSNCVAELDRVLQSMQDLKPPGVSGAKITAITSLCTANIKDETVLIQKVYAHFKKAPGNKKLGVLYVVDSVSRQWLEQARKAGQSVGSGAADGTFAAGVNHVTELLPALISDILAVVPEEQKVKIKKLVDIWERGNTFPASMLSGFKQKLEAPAANAAQSTTPTGTPPRDYAMAIDTAKPPAPDTASILANLQALANLPKPSAPAALAQGSSGNNVSFPPTNMVPSVNQAYSMPPAPAVNTTTPPVNAGMFGLPQNMFPNQQPHQAPAQPPQMPPMPAGNQPMNGGGDGGLQQQLQILAAFKSQGIPESQWPSLLAVVLQSQNQNNTGGSVAAAAAAAIPQQQQQLGLNNAYGGGRDEPSRDRNGYDQYMRSPPGRYGRDRSRSRSPRRGDRYRNDSPPRRGSPTYGDYRDGENRRNRDRGGNRGQRQRSPNRNQRSPSPSKDDIGAYERFIEYDPSLGNNMIKVLSRTLFVGGVTCPESELRSIFARHGRVQTCIVNVDKRHAFVKMVTRKEAEVAKVEMEHYKSNDMQLRTRWGVGFGPRPCSDYATGISVIPIDRLTDADRKWMLTAEFGGSGGKPIEPGLVVEEPDIEIGAGVSSKAISRRMATDKSGNMGPRSSREQGGGQGGQGGAQGAGQGGGQAAVQGASQGGGQGGGRQRDRGGNSRSENVNQMPLGNGRSNDHVNHNGNNNTAPAVPGFGFPFMAQNGMPMFNQPPPPGAN